MIGTDTPARDGRPIRSYEHLHSVIALMARRRRRRRKRRRRRREEEEEEEGLFKANAVN